MKIGLVCPYNYSRPGGVQAVVAAMKHELEQRDHTVKIIAPNAKNAHSSNGVILLGQSAVFNSPFSTMADISLRTDNAHIDTMFQDEKFDVVHFHEPWVPALAMQLLRRSPATNVATFHAKLPETPLAKAIERTTVPYTRSIFKHLHGLTAVSDAAAELVRSLTDDPVVIIPNGIDTKRYRPIAKNRSDSSTKTIVFVGRLEKRKGVEYLLAAYRQLLSTHPDTRLIICGDGPKRRSLETYAHKYSLDQVEFRGFVSESEKIECMATADIFTSPAIYGESFGIVLLEAMALDTPIVAGNNPGYSSVMRGYGFKSLVDPRDTEEYATKLREFIDDQSLRKEWKAWAKAYIPNFTYPKIVTSYLDSYREAQQRKTNKQ